MNDKQLKQIGDLFKDARVKSGKSIRTIGIEADISHPSVINAEEGKNMNVITMFNLMRVYGIPFGKIQKILK